MACASPTLRERAYTWCAPGGVPGGPLPLSLASWPSGCGSVGPLSSPTRRAKKSAKAPVVKPIWGTCRITQPRGHLLGLGSPHPIRKKCRTVHWGFVGAQGVCQRLSSAQKNNTPCSGTPRSSQEASVRPLPLSPETLLLVVIIPGGAHAGPLCLCLEVFSGWMDGWMDGWVGG